MFARRSAAGPFGLFAFLALTAALPAQPPGGPGGPGGFMGQTRKLVKQFDKDGDGRLNKEERQAAREFLQKERAGGRGPRGAATRANSTSSRTT